MKIQPVVKPPHGGSRKGAGRKSKWGEKTKVLTFRVPISKVDIVKEHFKRLLEAPINEYI